MKTILLLVMLIACGQISVAQCGKTSVITSSKTEYLDARGTLQRSVDEESKIEISKSEIIITPGDQQKMIGTITADTCNWKQPFKEGKSIIEATFSREGQAGMNATITIEGKDGKVTFLMQIEQMPDRKIKVIADKFAEKV